MFAQLNDVDKVKVEQDVNTRKVSEDCRQIQLDEIGEASLPPDRIRCIITCSNVKESVEAVKQSVTRRLNYITQALRNNHLKEDQYNVHKIISHEEEGFKMCAEVVIHFPTVELYEKTVNFLVEKLESSIKVSKPYLYHSEGSLSNTRRQASLNAIRNCRTKALSISQYLNQTLGAAHLIQETDTSEYSTLNNTTSEVPTHLSLHEEIELRTVTVIVKVHVIFQCVDRKKKIQR